MAYPTSKADIYTHTHASDKSIRGRRSMAVFWKSLKEFEGGGYWSAGRYSWYLTIVEEDDDDGWFHE